MFTRESFGLNLKNKGTTTIPEHHLPKNEDPQGSDLAPFFGDFSQSEKFS